MDSTHSPELFISALNDFFENIFISIFGFSFILHATEEEGEREIAGVKDSYFVI